MIIYTYGGGDILYNIFQGVAKLHNGGVLKQLFAIGGMIGLTMAVIKTFFSNQNVTELVRTWFLPLVISYSLFFMPKSQVFVKDIISQSEKSVANVPYGLALVARLSSTLGHQMTRGIETALRVPGTLQYNKTGHIFGAEHMMDMANFTWTDPTTEQNMRNFVTNCITYDVMLGRYSLKSLKHKVDLWSYIRDHTSRNRGVYWLDVQGNQPPAYCSCREAATRLDANMRSEVDAKKHIFKNMPIAFQALTGIAESAETLLRQQIMLRSFVEGVEYKASSLGLGHDFAVQRAYLQQQSTMTIAGGLAGKSVIITRAIFEALILVSFIFVIPALALPMGIRFFMRWAEMVVWINLWPPVYAILNFILQSAAQSRAEAILKFQASWSNLGGAGKGLSLATATPLSNLYNDMVAYAGWASLFVPVLAYMILKGGMSSFVHIAGSMMQASQGGAAAAAQEHVTGNYSYGNVSMGNTHYNTGQMNQQGLAARFSDGYMQESTGNYDITHAPGGSVMDQKMSHLPVNFSMGQSLSSGYQRRAEDSMQSAYSEGAQLNETWENSYNEMASIDQHMSTHSGTNISESTGMDASTQKSLHDTLSQAQTFGKRYGMNESRSMSILGGMHGAASAGGDIKGVGLSLAGKAGVDYSGSADKNKMIEDAMNIATSKDFSESMTQLKQFSKREDFSEGQDMGKRLAETLSTTFDQNEQLSQSISQNLSASETYSKNASYARDNSARIDQNYTNQFWGWFEEQAGGTSKALELWNSKDAAPTAYREQKVQEFQQKMEGKAMHGVDERVGSERGFLSATSQMKKHHERSIATFDAPSREGFEENRGVIKKTSALDEVPQSISQAQSKIKQQGELTNAVVNYSLNTQDQTLNMSKDKIKQEFEDNDSQWIGRRAARGLTWWNYKKPSDDM